MDWMISALASVTAGQGKVKPLLQWDDGAEVYADAVNAMQLEAVLRGEMRDGDSL